MIIAQQSQHRAESRIHAAAQTPKAICTSKGLFMLSRLVKVLLKLMVSSLVGGQCKEDPSNHCLLLRPGVGASKIPNIMFPRNLIQMKYRIPQTYLATILVISSAR